MIDSHASTKHHIQQRIQELHAKINQRLQNAIQTPTHSTKSLKMCFDNLECVIEPTCTPQESNLTHLYELISNTLQSQQYFQRQLSMLKQSLNKNTLSTEDLSVQNSDLDKSNQIEKTRQTIFNNSPILQISSNLCELSNITKHRIERSESHNSLYKQQYDFIRLYQQADDEESQKENQISKENSTRKRLDYHSKPSLDQFKSQKNTELKAKQEKPKLAVQLQFQKCRSISNGNNFFQISQRLSPSHYDKEQPRLSIKDCKESLVEITRETKNVVREKITQYITASESIRQNNKGRLANANIELMNKLRNGLLEKIGSFNIK